MDPLTGIAIGAAVGGASGKFVEKAWDSGEKWLQSFFKNHRGTAQETAKKNSIEFLNELAQRVKQLEESEELLPEKINEAQDNPDFSAILQEALMTASQTSNHKKHALLADLVTTRLKAEPETFLAITSKMACNSIAFLSDTHLKILAVVANLYLIRASEIAPDIDQNEFQSSYELWLTARLAHIKELKYRKRDLHHLTSLNLIIRIEKASNLDDLIFKNDLKFSFSNMTDSELQNKIFKLWHSGINQSLPSSAGVLIGILASDEISQTKTVLDYFH